MKIAIALIVLGCSLLQVGCYSYSTLTTEEDKHLLDSNDADIKIAAVDGSVIEVDSYHYLVVREPQDCFYVSGTAWGKGSGEGSPFHGFAVPDSLQHADIPAWVRDHAGNSGPAPWFTDRAGLLIRADEEDILAVRKSDGVGIWYSGKQVVAPRRTVQAENRNPFLSSSPDEEVPVSGKLGFGEIDSIERKHLSVVKTAILGGTAVFCIIVGAAGPSLDAH